MAVVSVPQRRLRVAVSLTVLIVLAGCGGTDSPSGSTGTDTSTSAAASGGAFAPVEAGKMTTCTHLPYAPFQFEQGGEVVGFDVDLVDLVATELGLEQAIVDTPFEGIKS